MNRDRSYYRKQRMHAIHRKETILRQLGGEKLLLRLDAPLVRIPKVDIQFTAVIHGDLPLLKPFAPAVRSLSGEISL